MFACCDANDPTRGPVHRTVRLRIAEYQRIASIYGNTASETHYEPWKDLADEYGAGVPAFKPFVRCGFVSGARR